MKGLTELQETKELWNLGDGLRTAGTAVDTSIGKVARKEQYVYGNGFKRGRC